MNSSEVEIQQLLNNNVQQCVDQRKVILQQKDRELRDMMQFLKDGSLPADVSPQAMHFPACENSMTLPKDTSVAWQHLIRRFLW